VRTIGWGHEPRQWSGTHYDADVPNGTEGVAALHDERPTGSTDRVRPEPKARARRAAGFALLGYAVLAVALLSRTWFGGNVSENLVGGGNDPLGLVWFLAWLPHAVESGHSPLFSVAVMAPQGANLLNSTSILLPALLFWPLTTLGTPMLSYNVLATLAIAGSAWAAYFAMLRLSPHRSSAWIGGALFGFGGYMVGQTAAHANLLVVIFPPLVAILFDDVRKDARSARRTGLLLGLAAAAQVFINEEILATTTIMAGSGLCCAALLYRPNRATVDSYLRALAMALLVFALVAGPFLVYQFFGPQHVSGVIVSSGKYVNDALGFIVPSAFTLVTTTGAEHLVGTFSGYDGEFGAYFGLPLLALVAFAAWRLRGRATLLLMLMLTAAVFSLGPHLRADAHDTGVLLPWVVPSHLPLLQNVVPSRFNLFIWLAVAAIVVLLIDELRRRPILGHTSLSAAVCVVALFPVIPKLAGTESVTVPAVLVSSANLHKIAPGAREVLVAPSPNGQFGMYAEARADFGYVIPEGGVFVPGPSYGMRHGPLLYALALLGRHPSTRAGRTATDEQCLRELALQPGPVGRCARHYRHALRDLRVDAVVVTGRSDEVRVRRYTAFFTALLGASRNAGRASVYRVRSGGS
jgi:hypothetical protein